MQHTMTRSCGLLCLALVASTAWFAVFKTRERESPDAWGRLLRQDPKTVKRKAKTLDFDLPRWGSATWCNAPSELPLDFENCKHDAMVNIIQLHGGLTSALKQLLFGAMYSFEANRCFFVDESDHELRLREDKSQEHESLLSEYFEPIGLPRDSSILLNAIANNMTKVVDVMEHVYAHKHRRRVFKDKTTIANLNYRERDGHFLKKVIMRRLWRPLPEVRNHTCSTLERVHKLNKDYIALSVRRGDAKGSIDLQRYLYETGRAIDDFFDKKPPRIFVATDDCTVMTEFRRLRPHWKFVSECDVHPNSIKDGNDPDALANVRQWTKIDTEAHFEKFLVELYGMALAKVFIGVSTTDGKPCLQCWQSGPSSSLFSF